MRWLLNKPDSLELAPLWKLLPGVSGHEQVLSALTDAELTAAAQAVRDDAQFCACGREAARRALGEQPYAAQVTYAPVSEFGFDVLRDRLVTDVAGLVAGDPDVARRIRKLVV